MGRLFGFAGLQKATRRKAVLLGLGFSFVAAFPASAQAPKRDVTFVVPFSAGGGSDVLARNIAATITKLKLLPTTLLIENRPGGSAAIGYSYLAGRKGDPHYIATVSVSFFTTPLLGKSPVSYKDFTPVAAIAQDPYILAVKADSDVKTVQDLAKKGSLTAGTTGVVSDQTILARMLEGGLKTKVRVVPYEGDGEILSALLGGHIDIQFGNPSEILSQVQGGALRALAVSSNTRLEALPDVPTFKEQGLDIELVQLRGVVMPGGVPEESVAYWQDLLKKVAESPEWRDDYLKKFNVQPGFLASKEFGVEMQKVSDRYAALMKEVGLLKN